MKRAFSLILRDKQWHILPSRKVIPKRMVVDVVNGDRFISIATAALSHYSLS